MINPESLDVSAAKLAQLRGLFPEVFTEGKIDFKRLRDVLGDEVSFNKEHYELSWAGKSEARAQIQKTTSATLIPDGGRAADGCGNLFIEGENLDVLHVLQRSYFGKIKMIYIDPPYNTGNDSFVYPDDYSERQDAYKKRVGITDENGFLNKQDLWKKNSKENGQFHSVWLSMMYPRLYLARNLLREDGVIFISIDDNEQANLRLLCDEIFGAENFVAEITVLCNPKGRSQEKFFATNHEYLFVYSKSILPKGCFSIAKDEEQIESDYPEEDSDGKFRVLELRNTHREFGKHNRKNLFYPFYVDENGAIFLSHQENSHKALPIWEDGFEGCWTWEKKKSEQDIDLLVSKKINGRWKIYRKSYANGADRMLKTILLDKSFYTEKGQKEFNILFESNDKLFQSPKSPFLLRQLFQTYTKETDIILDFFAGSGTTAHAVLELNEQDGGNRQFICVQLPEPLEESSEAYKAGYRTIADICKARITKVIDKIQAGRDSNTQTDLLAESPKHILGFSSFKLAPSNFKQWRGDVAGEQAILEQLELFRDSEQPNSDNHSMLVELLLKAGFPLTANVAVHTVAGQELYNVESGQLVFFFDAYNDSVKDFIFTLKPNGVVCLNRVFNNNDHALTNFQLGLKDAGIELQII